MAGLAHLAGNTFYGDVLRPATFLGFTLFAVGLLSTAAVVAPRRHTLLALCVAIPVSAALQVPFLANHWLLAAIVSVAYLLSRGRWEIFRGIAQGVTLAFYAFAAFAKLNEGFFDPATSCAIFYADEAVRALGIGSLNGASPVAPLVMWVSAAIELSVVPLLLFGRTRKAGVLLAITFHSVLTLDLGQHFYDFTSVLLALFVLFLDGSFAARFEQRPRWMGEVTSRVALQFVAFFGVLTTLSSTMPLTVWTDWFVRNFTWWWWFPYVVYVVATAVRSRSDAHRLHVPTVGWALIVVVVVNGLTPYLEVKTAFSWNMYSNLQVVNGESNHLIIREGHPLRDSHQQMVEVVSADGTGLKAYVNSGYLIAWPSFRQYASSHPEESVTYRRDGRLIELGRFGDDPVLSSRTPAWWRWVPVRSVRADGVPACQSGYLPAL